MDVNLKRTVFTKESTIGPLYINEVHECFCLELPWNDNQHDVSCIPVGRYKISLTFSTARKYVVPMLHDVPGREAKENGEK